MSRRALPAGHPPWRCRNAGLTTSGATNYMRHEAGGGLRWEAPAWR